MTPKPSVFRKVLPQQDCRLYAMFKQKGIIKIRFPCMINFEKCSIVQVRCGSMEVSVRLKSRSQETELQFDSCYCHMGSQSDADDSATVV